MKVETTRLNAEVNVETAKKLKIALIEDDSKFSDWLREQIDRYLKERKAGRRKAKGEAK